MARSLQGIVEAFHGRNDDTNWGLITYGATQEALDSIYERLPLQTLEAIIHFCPAIDKSEGLLWKYVDDRHIPYVFENLLSLSELYLRVDYSCHVGHCYTFLPFKKVFMRLLLKSQAQ